MAFFIVVVFFMCFINVMSLDNGLGRTPMMGWTNWERFRCITDCKSFPKQCISELLYKEMADRLVADGYAAAGYKYVNIDDCWTAKTRDSNQRLRPDPERFPSGIKALADYIHSKGLRFGIYGDIGHRTCGGYLGSEFYLAQDAQTFAEWGVDFLMMDGCFSHHSDYKYSYPAMSKLLNATGRHIHFLCSWPSYLTVHNVTPDYHEISRWCNTWRNWVDVQDSWDSILRIVDFYGEDRGNFSDVARPGKFNDADMLIVGDFGLSYDQQKAQMALWAMFAAPLRMSNDLRNIRNESRDILLNRYVIAVNQDKMGRAGHRVSLHDNWDIWHRNLSHGQEAVVILNRSDFGMPRLFSSMLRTLGTLRAGPYKAFETFTQRYLGAFNTSDVFQCRVAPSGVFMITLRWKHVNK